ncbi:HD-GYP domain-containing protein (plasmid) [Rhizobium sp. NIBRBAC000502774]|nr:HD-GYP domain-containing protein [Rhizobium sp. NIBRBAC000502774]
MKKRIRLHQIRVGMYIEELEGSRIVPVPNGRFLISSKADIDRLMRSHALSVVIDTQKGRDIDADAPAGVFDAAVFNAHLSANFSATQIHLARKTIEETRPHVRSILAEARLHGAFNMKPASQAVERIMSEAMTNAGALIGVAKLKDKDEGTFLHSLAVSALMVAFGRSLGLDEEKVRLLGLGGLVHDLGKVALPIEVLRKPGKLTAEELALIRTHPERGVEMLAGAVGMPQVVLDICLYHHEKFDGSGYLRKLVGSSIPLVARIAAICDVYDALTTVRPYKRAWSQAEAIDTMLLSAGHFDPDLLKAFVSGMIINGTLH